MIENAMLRTSVNFPVNVSLLIYSSSSNLQFLQKLYDVMPSLSTYLLIKSWPVCIAVDRWTVMRFKTKNESVLFLYKFSWGNPITYVERHVEDCILTKSSAMQFLVIFLCFATRIGVTFECSKAFLRYSSHLWMTTDIEMNFVRGIIAALMSEPICLYILRFIKKNLNISPLLKC